jgi:hypothetical protein
MTLGTDDAARNFTGPKQPPPMLGSKHPEDEMTEFLDTDGGGLHANRTPVALASDLL